MTLGLTRPQILALSAPVGLCWLPVWPALTLPSAAHVSVPWGLPEWVPIWTPAPDTQIDWLGRGLGISLTQGQLCEGPSHVPAGCVGGTRLRRPHREEAWTRETGVFRRLL